MNTINQAAKILLCFTFVILSADIARAEEKFEDLIKRAQEMKEQGKFPQAISELSWASKQLEKLHAEKLQSFFPQTAGAFTGGEFKSNNAMGFTSVERTYASPKGKIKLSLSGSSASDGAAKEGLGMLAGFAGMAAMMGQNEGTDTVRIKGNRGIVQQQSGKTELTVPLSSGLILQAEPVGTPAASKEELIALAEAYDVAGLDTYLAKK